MADNVSETRHFAVLHQRKIDAEKRASLDSAQAVLNKKYSTSEYQAPSAVKVETIDGKVVITDNRNSVSELSLEDKDLYVKERSNKLNLYEEENNEIEAYTRWGEQNNKFTLSQADVQLATYSDMTRAPAYQDFSTYATEVGQGAREIPGVTPGNALWDTPYTNARELETQAAVAAKEQRGGVADVLDPATNSQTSQRLTPQEIERIAASEESDRLKKEAVSGGQAEVQQTNGKTTLSPAVAEAQANSNSKTTTENEGPDTLDPVVEGSSTSVDGTGTAQATNNNADVSQPNPLDEHESYTYSLALHVLDKKEHDLMLQNATEWSPQHTLIAGAGRWNSSREGAASGNNTGAYMNREPGWADNFFFDGLKITQVIGPTSTTRTTNSIDIEFTIVEPMGLSLLDRLIKTADRLKEKNYMHLCYMLQIDFYDSEKGLLSEFRKFIPITLIDMRIKVTNKGSEYGITAAPFHHRSLLQSVATTPANFEVTSATLREFFKDDNSSDEAVVNQAIDSQRTAQAANNNAGTRTTDTSIQSADPTYQIGSYVAAYNGWHSTLKRLNIIDNSIEPTSIRVRFHDDIIAGEKMARPEDSTAGRGAMANKDRYLPGTNVAKDMTRDTWDCRAGTSVPEIINNAMLSSEFVRKQVLIANKNENNAGSASKEGVVQWWKILPSVKIKGYDQVINKWSFDITYFVLPYTVHNTKHPNLPKSKVYKANCVKNYSYYYTGKNVSVIDFQVEFDMTYLTTVASLKELNVSDPSRNAQASEATAEQAQPPKDSNDRKATGSTITPVSLNTVSINLAESTGKKLDKDPISVALSGIADSIYSSSSGDMLTVTLKIIGDPQLIKQDDIFMNVARFYDPARRSGSSDGIMSESLPANTADGIANNNNSIIMDAGEVLAWVELRMPVDVSDETGGLRNPESAGDLSAFTGVYKILDVANEFRSGAFTQTLTLIRYQEQPQDEDFREKLTQEREESIAADNRTSNSNSTDGSTASSGSSVVSSSDGAKADESPLPSSGAQADQQLPQTFQFDGLDIDKIPTSEIGEVGTA